VRLQVIANRAASKHLGVSGQPRKAGAAGAPGRRRHGDAHLWRMGGARRLAGRDSLSPPHGYHESRCRGCSCVRTRSRERRRETASLRILGRAIPMPDGSAYQYVTATLDLALFAEEHNLLIASDQGEVLTTARLPAPTPG